MKIVKSKKLTNIIEANKDLPWETIAYTFWLDGCNPFDLLHAGLQMAEQCIKEGKSIYEVVIDRGELVYFFVGHGDELEKKLLKFVDDATVS